MSASQPKRYESPRSRLIAAAEKYVRASVRCPDAKMEYEEEWACAEFLQYLVACGSFYRWSLRVEGALPEFTLGEFIELWQEANDWAEQKFGAREELQSEEHAWDVLFSWIVQEDHEHFAAFT